MNTYSLRLEPLLPDEAIIAFAAIALGLALYAFVRRARGAWARAFAFGAALLLLLNPSLVTEERLRESVTVTAVLDDSASMRLGQRSVEAETALERLRAAVAAQEGVDLRIIRAGQETALGAEDPGTRLFSALERALADLPISKRAGIVLITDGGIHDLPTPQAASRLGAPLHGLIVGQRGEQDRRIIIENAPRFALLNQAQTVRFRVIDPALPQGAQLRVRLELGGETLVEEPIPANETTSLSFTPQRTGKTYLTLHVDAGPRELTRANNDAAAALTVVRDRLRVLLISGQPHAGERVWRNILKSDPAVDLVHFTILRPAYKQDSAPINEVSLIAFPVRELFEIKLPEFDLVIFDRDARGGLLGPLHLANIADYVRAGGALLDATGPDLAQPVSFVNSPLRSVLPSRPTGQIHVTPFSPALTDVGRRHPVTAELPRLFARERGADTRPGNPGWGRWHRMADVEPLQGWTLMQGPEARPLLLLDRVEKGRVAQLLSDQAWLWARGYEGGGPHNELLRRLAHWLMKEPDLEEDQLSANAEGGRILAARRSLVRDESAVTLVAPDGETQTIEMREGEDLLARGSAEPQAGPGLYRLSDGRRTALAAYGLLEPKEFFDPAASDASLAPVARATGGAVHWLADGWPEIRATTRGAAQSGRSFDGTTWIGLQTDGESRIINLSRTPLLPALLAAFLIALMAGLAWWREGR